jgi:Fe(3+) dicitrate transport protein
VTLLEDGIPVTYSPYGDNASYYHPAIDRFDRIEVLKGANALQFGPQTIGGVINYITPDPPQALGGYLQGTLGNRDYFNGKIRLGGAGFLLDYTRKQGDGARNNMNHEIDDLNLKWVGQISARQAVTLRGNYYHEDSLVTYSGLTEAEFRRLGRALQPRSATTTSRPSASVPRPPTTSSSTAVRYSPPTSTPPTSRATGSASRAAAPMPCTPDAMPTSPSTASPRVSPRTGWRAGWSTPRPSSTARRADCASYVTWGVEPRLTMPNRLGEFQMGLKAHFEQQDRVQDNANAPTFAQASALSRVEDNLRRVDAYSGFVAQRFDLGSLALTPIVRHESISSSRSSRLPGGSSGSGRIEDTSPGLGATWNPSPGWTVFGSLYQGFAPPRVEDVINGAGTVVEVAPERSTNLELGVRGKPLAGTSLQAAYFRNDFRNLVAVGSVAGGATPLSQGQALFEGFEVSGRSELGGGLWARLAWTWVPTADQQTAFRTVPAPGGTPALTCTSSLVNGVSTRSAVPPAIACPMPPNTPRRWRWATRAAASAASSRRSTWATSSATSPRPAAPPPTASAV